MQEEKDFDLIDTVFFSTSSAGGKAPVFAKANTPLADANDIEAPKACDTIITYQDGDYTTKVFPKLHAAGWNGYQIDAASTLRMGGGAVVVPDPVNLSFIKDAVVVDTKNFIDGNYTNSILLMGVGGLFHKDLVRWVSSVAYQAASGGGANHIRELLRDIGVAHDTMADELASPASAILDIDRKVVRTIREDVPTEFFLAPLAGGLTPWIDKQFGSDQSREEWKNQTEVDEIPGTVQTIPADGLCVWIDVIHCRGLGLTLRLKHDLPLDETEQIIRSGNLWAKWVPSDHGITEKELMPASVTDGLGIGVGCVRKLNTGPGYVSAFVIGDQLLRGTAESLRRTLRILLGK